jgi:RimJ/RimL family protein N-acetyltransferase
MRVEAMRPDDWRTWRDLRLEALQDTPIGFGRTYEEERRFTEEQWRAGGPRPGQRFIAYDGDEPVGIAGGFLDEDDQPVLFGVYVRPGHRGGGVLPALVTAVQGWAPAPLVLHVHEDNHRARRAYEKLGFVLTGEISPGEGIDGRDLQQMRAFGADAALR